MTTLTARWLGRREYVATVALQEELVRQRRAGEIGDTLLLLEHEPVITVGRGRDGGEEGDGVLPPALRADPSLKGGETADGNGYGNGVLPPALRADPSMTGGETAGAVPVVETSRGGQATYHGPGQLVAYPIIDLRQWRKDLHWYLRQLEAAGALALQHWGLIAGNVHGHTGVWIDNRKIASIGVAVRGWITYHGLALNVACDMSGFQGFNPCGLPAATMVSLAELGMSVGVAEAGEVFAQAFHAVFGYDTLNLLLSGNPGGLAVSN